VELNSTASQRWAAAASLQQQRRQRGGGAAMPKKWDHLPAAGRLSFRPLVRKRLRERLGVRLQGKQRVPCRGRTWWNWLAHGAAHSGPAAHLFFLWAALKLWGADGRDIRPMIGHWPAPPVLPPLLPRPCLPACSSLLTQTFHRCLHPALQISARTLFQECL
jgi:hypothetical protein